MPSHAVQEHVSYGRSLCPSSLHLPFFLLPIHGTNHKVTVFQDISGKCWCWHWCLGPWCITYSAQWVYQNDTLIFTYRNIVVSSETDTSFSVDYPDPLTGHQLMYLFPAKQPILESEGFSCKQNHNLQRSFLFPKSSQVRRSSINSHSLGCIKISVLMYIFCADHSSLRESDLWLCSVFRWLW